MKILHTSDWHLGQKFFNFDRDAEFQQALHWLLEQLKIHAPDVLLVSGDVFDTLNPSHAALTMYYGFLNSLRGTSVRHTVITGGNHDSATMLAAPKGILEHLSVHIVAQANPHNLAEEVIKLYDNSGQLEAIIAAVPFLRERDLPAAMSSENTHDRIARVRAGIQQHFEDVAKLTVSDDVPVVAMGHLYASGGQDDKKMERIYAADKENIAAQAFPKAFDYVALGHLHRPQPVGGLRHIRYSGSLISLDFSELRDNKSVTLLTFEGKKLTDVSPLSIPAPRLLRRFRGTVSELTQQLLALDAEVRKQPEPLSAWVEVTLTNQEGSGISLRQNIEEVAKPLKIEILSVRMEGTANTLQELLEQGSRLKDLSPQQVFEKRLEAEKTTPEQRAELLATFQELWEIGGF